jgi:ribonuclease-3
MAQNKFDWNEFQKDTIDKIGKDNLIKYILNEKNRIITEKFIRETLGNYGIDYKVNDIRIFQIAMTHPSYILKDWTLSKNFKLIFMGINLIEGDMLLPISEQNRNMAVSLGKTSYERLEFIGDSVLRLIISDYLFIRYKDMQEGDLTRLRSQLENGSALAEMTRRIGLNKYVLLSRNHEVNKAREKNEKIQCDIFEAFIAALYYDTCGIKYEDIGKNQELISFDRGIGFGICYNFVTSLIEDEIDLTLLLETDTNYKDEILQEFHRRNWGDPKYGLMEVIVDSTKMGKKYFKMYVRDNEGNIIGQGIGSSKQRGEKLAAKKALQFLQIIPEDNEDIILNENSDEIYFRNNNDDDGFTKVSKNKRNKN